MKVVLRVLATLTLVAIMLVVGLLVWRSLQQHAVASGQKIHTPDGIEQAGFVRVGGSDQWVQIRGEHRSNPILLFVHGGPGFSMAPLVPAFRRWEKDFTVVQWDQRDAGRTFSRNGPQPISIDQVTRDGLEVADHLRQELGPRPIILVGHSWGSAIGLNMVQRRPDLFAAYVGFGQMVSHDEQEALSYATVLARVRANGDAKAVAELEAIGPPPYSAISELLVERKWLATVDTPAEQTLFKRMTPVVLFTPGMSLKELWDYNAAPKVAQKMAYPDVEKFDARRIGAAFAVPIFILAGDQDLYTPGGGVPRYLAEISAPSKSFVLLKGGGHNVVLTAPDAVLHQLLTRVRPVATQPQPR